MIIDPQEQNRRDAYFFAISLIIPRPIAFVTSQNAEGVVNSAPFSYFNGISTKPALFTISIADKKDSKKDTLNNILSKKEFCVNFVSEQMAEGVTVSSAEFPPEESEMNYNGFSLTDSERIAVPRIKESPATIEAKLVRTIDDLGNFTLVIAEVLLYHVNDELIDKETGYVDANNARFLGRLGGMDFATLGQVKTVGRKPWNEYEPTT